MVEKLFNKLKESIRKTPLLEDKDEFKEEDEQLSSDHGANMGEEVS